RGVAGGLAADRTDGGTGAVAGGGVRPVSAPPDPRFVLLGEYSTPRFRYGERVDCEARGLVEIVGLKEAPIRWPVGRPVGGRKNVRGMVVYGGLSEAIRREASEAVAYHWGVTAQTVWAWRRATDGATRLRREAAAQPAVAEGRRKA